MSEIKYQYAYNENGEVVSINDFTKEESKLHTFRCISCGNILLPRAIGSKSRRAHFYHKELIDCNGETYLHELGKAVIKKKFDENSNFFISYDATVECDNKACELRNSLCSTICQKTFNLKNSYDTCSVEAPIQSYVADLLLTNSKKSLAPTLIEICVTHKCTEDKRNSGLRIIEIQISNEKDIDTLRNCCSLESRMYDYYAHNNGFRVEFINFKSVFVERLKVLVKRVSYTPSKDQTVLVRDVQCDNADKKCISGSKYEYNVIVPAPYHQYGSDLGFLFQLWLGKYKRLRICRICKFYFATEYENSPICRLSKKYNTPTYPEMRYAERCRSFHQKDDQFFWELEGYKFLQVIGPESPKETYRVIIAGSSSFCNYSLLKERCDHFLSEKMKTHTVVLLVGTSYQTEVLVERYAEEKSLFVDHFTANWDRYGQQEAAFQSNEDKLRTANALIAFWDGKSIYTGKLIESAKKLGIPVKSVSYKG